MPPSARAFSVGSKAKITKAPTAAMGGHLTGQWAVVSSTAGSKVNIQIYGAEPAAELMAREIKGLPRAGGRTKRPRLEAPPQKKRKHYAQSQATKRHAAPRVVNPDVDCVLALCLFLN